MRNVTLVLFCIFAACSGGTTVVPRSVASLPQSSKTQARLVIHVPPRCKRGPCRSGRHARYVSPATASLAYAIDGVAQTPVVISTSNPNCTVLGPVSYLTCSVPMMLSPGHHTFSFTAKDANGNVLSANTSVGYTVVAGQANEIPVTLGGVAASIAVIPPNVPAVAGGPFNGYSIYGNAALTFDAVAVDADGNFIVGPGAPQPYASATPAGMTVSPAPSTAPNNITLQSTYQSTDPAVAQSSSLTVVATPVPHSGGTTVTATVPLQLYQPWIYVADDNDNAIKAFDEEGNVKSAAGGFPNISSPNGIAYDPHTGYLYVANGGSDQILVYDRLGHQQATTMSTPGTPEGIVYDPNLNFFYVTAGGPNVVAFNEAGVQQTLTATTPFSGLELATGVAMVPANEEIFVTDNDPGPSNPSVKGFTEEGALETSGGFSEAGAPSGIAYDSHNGFLYVVSDAVGTVQAYDTSGNLQTLNGAFSSLSSATEPAGIAYDPHNDWFYVGSCAAAVGVAAFDSEGNAQATQANWPTIVPGLTVVP